MKNQLPHSPYDQLGGEVAVRKLVDRFYDLMDSTPSAKVIREMHPASLQSSRQKLFEFLSGFLGGPSIYIERHGHPRLRMRHHPFAIDQTARDNWLLCMHQALEEQVTDPLLLMQLKASFTRTANHLINCESVDE
ncbi:MAG: group II truncated hemoglobin [Pseudomonadota bacterium]